MVRIGMNRIILSFILVYFWCFGAVSAEPNYQIFVDDIQQRLALAEAQYQKGDVQSARQSVQLAYFEV